MCIETAAAYIMLSDSVYLTMYVLHQRCKEKVRLREQENFRLKLGKDCVVSKYFTGLFCVNIFWHYVSLINIFAVAY